MRSWARAMSRSVQIQLLVIFWGRLGSCKEKGRIAAVSSMKDGKVRLLTTHKDEAGECDRYANEKVNEEEPAPSAGERDDVVSAPLRLGPDRGHAPGQPVDPIKARVDGRLKDAAEEVADRARRVEDDSPLGNFVRAVHATDQELNTLGKSKEGQLGPHRKDGQVPLTG